MIFELSVFVGERQKQSIFVPDPCEAMADQIEEIGEKCTNKDSITTTKCVKNDLQKSGS